MQAPYRQIPGMIRPTHVRAWRVALLAIVLPVALVAAGIAYLRWQATATGHSEAQAGTEWMPTQKLSYTPDPTPKPPATPPAEDPMAERWAALQRQLAQMQLDITALKNRPDPKAATLTPPRPPVQKHASMLYVSHEAKAAKPDAARTYPLAPAATKIACHIETVMNSDAGDTFTAKTTTPVYDTATGQHLLIPQNSTILGKYEGEGLLYGNERLPTLSLSLTLPSGRTVDLGHSPVTNQAGTSGLASTVDQHWGRLFGAVFIGGALRGGAMALQTGMGGSGPAGQIGAGITQSGGQVIQRQQGRALDTRPTIRVEAGELCHVILMKPLQLAAVGP